MNKVLALIPIALLSLSLFAVACAEEIDPVDPPITAPDDAKGSARGSTSRSEDAGRTEALQQSDGGWAIPSPSDAGDASSTFCSPINEAPEPNDGKIQALTPTTCGSIGGNGDAVDQYEATSNATGKKTITFKASGDATLTLSAFGFSQSIKSGESIDIPSFGGMSLKVRLSVQSPTSKPQSYRIDAP